MRKVSLFLVVACIFFVACNPKTEKQKFPSEETGGPCTFDTTIQPIIVQRIVPIDSGSVRIVFQIPYSNDSFDHTLDIAEYEKEFHVPVSIIKVTDTFQFLELRTVGGSCAGKPQVYMKKYSKN